MYFCARVPVLIFGRAPGYPKFIKLPKNLVYKAQFFSRREKAKVGGSPYKRVQQNQNLFFSVIRSRMLPPFISDTKDKHTTFIFSVIRSGILLPFISDAKDKHLTFIFSVIRSRMFPPFISDAKHKHPTFILASYGAECYRNSFPNVKANTRYLF